MPDLGAVIVTAVSANDMGSQDTLTTVPSGKGFPAFDLGLDDCELPGLYNGWVAVFNIILRNFAVIDDHFLCKEIDGVGFLKEGIALVLLVGKDALNGGG